MENPTEITVLGFKGSSDSFWGEDKPKHISYQDYGNFISSTKSPLPESIAIHGHSTDGGTLEDKTPAEIAAALSQKYAGQKNQLKKICLLACSVSQSENNQASFAQSLANELYIKGFDEVIIYAPPPIEEGRSSRILLQKGFGITDSITYYVVPDSEITEFDKEEKNRSKWENGRQILGPKFRFPDSFILNTKQYSASQALLIKSNIDDFFSKVWKGLYDFFSNFGSSIQIENQEIKTKYQELTQSYNNLIANEKRRIEFQQSPIGKYSLTSSFKHFNNAGFLQTDWTQQYTRDAKGNLEFPKIQIVEQNNQKIQKGQTEVELNGNKIKAINVYDFMQTYKTSIINYDKNLTEFNQELQNLKSNLLTKVQEYNQKTPNISEAKKKVMEALESYLRETDPLNIKQKQQDLTNALEKNPGWAEGLISKRVRTAVESASQIIEAEELAHKSTTAPRK